MRPMTDEEKAAEWLRCSESFLYFVNEYVQIYNATRRTWLPFKLWRFQAWTLKAIWEHKLTVILKARQLGLTWLMLAFALWLMLFRAAAAVGIFSKREEEAIDLLDNRLKGMYRRLPEFLRSREVEVDSKKQWVLSNGSWCRAFPTTAGDSYTFTLAMVDEADLAPDLDKLLSGVKPTIDAGGWLILLSRTDKTTPRSAFKAIYRAAKQRMNEWYSIFLPWHAHPERTAEWYQAQVQDSMSRSGTMDYVYEQYPATDAEALAAKSLDKRIPPGWLLKCYVEMGGRTSPLAILTPPLAPPHPQADGEGENLSPGPALGTTTPEGEGAPSMEAMVMAPVIPTLEVYRLPEDGHAYVVGADPAEGNPTSDDSAATVLDAVNGEEVAKFAGKFQPEVFGSYLKSLSHFFRQAGIMVERNNHGHTVILWLRDNAGVSLLNGLDGKPGWQTNSVSKAMLYDALAEGLRDRMVLIHSFGTYTQLSSIEGSSLNAPSGEQDDQAMSFALAWWAASGRGPYAILEFYRKQAEATARMDKGV